MLLKFSDFVKTDSLHILFVCVLLKLVFYTLI